MKKQLVLLIALSFGVFTFAQKKEIKALEKAVKKSNFAEAKNILSQLASMENGLDSKLVSKFNFYKAKALFAGGNGSGEDVDKALLSLKKVKGMVKEISELKQAMQNGILQKANTQYQSGEYKQASNGFYRLYNLVPQDTTFLYYAAASAVSAKDYDAALAHYKTLKDIGYNGSETQHYATNKETGKEEIMSKSQRDLFVKAGTYINPGMRVTPSKSAEITKNTAMILLTLDRKDEALAAIKEARALDPKNIDLITSQANLEYKAGNLDGFKSLIEEAVKLDPNNSDLFFNLGVVSAGAKDNAKAREYYKKAIELDAKNANALTNMASLILGEEEAIVSEMNGLGSSAADNARYDALKEKRSNLYKEAIPYLEKVVDIKPDDIDVLKTLRSIYSAVDDTAKFEAINSKIKTLTGN